ncbi:hypothetical protein C8R44DRAFT_864434 [Mycena epipterygia]|nr:hypothetical protein C8R44DRAFT_864434 [Mycena epipterygia]
MLGAALAPQPSTRIKEENSNPRLDRPPMTYPEFGFHVDHASYIIHVSLFHHYTTCPIENVPRKTLVLYANPYQASAWTPNTSISPVESSPRTSPTASERPTPSTSAPNPSTPPPPPCAPHPKSPLILPRLCDLRSACKSTRPPLLPLPRRCLSAHRYDEDSPASALQSSSALLRARQPHLDLHSDISLQYSQLGYGPSSTTAPSAPATPSSRTTSTRPSKAAAPTLHPPPAAPSPSAAQDHGARPAPSPSSRPRPTPALPPPLDTAITRRLAPDTEGKRRASVSISSTSTIHILSPTASAPFAAPNRVFPPSLSTENPPPLDSRFRVSTTPAPSLIHFHSILSSFASQF